MMSKEYLPINFTFYTGVFKRLCFRSIRYPFRRTKINEFNWM